MFQPITRNVFGNGSVNIEFYNDLIPCRKRIIPINSNQSCCSCLQIAALLAATRNFA